ncbi:MutS-related protein [Pontibacter populi]|uniref:DNA mismatch repair proteins mutS family domain-containing protein n=1 Tax=Pontibacter populi TaxID=890055 RepID=A0ABV1RUS9_9BACT
MMQIHDLKLKEDVLPFFNFTNNTYSEEQLLYLLTTPPVTEAEVRDRTTVIKGMLANWAVMENFTYRKLDLLEVHTFMVAIAGTGLNKKKLQSWLRLKTSETERQQLQSKLVQLIQLLNGLQAQYLNRLNSAVFPEQFKSDLVRTVSFLNSLNLDKLANQVLEHRFRVRDMIKFSEQLSTLNQDEVSAFWDYFFTFEAYWSVAKATLVHGFTFPGFSDDNFSIGDFYHPIVKSPVRNTLLLEEDKNVLLLTGPNMSGKSTLLKAIGLCVYLAHVGFTVPASTCTVPYFNTIAIAINLNDNLRDGYSHFMAEIENLRKVVRSTENSQKCFAVFDEIFRGTNVDDALDITQTTINGLTKIKGSYFLISTHLLQLEEQLHSSSYESIKEYFIECVLENETPRFTYKLKEGWSQLKIGRILFEQVGLSELLGK